MDETIETVLANFENALDEAHRISALRTVEGQLAALVHVFTAVGYAAVGFVRVALADADA